MRDTIEDRLLAGESAENVAEDLGLDVVDGAVVMKGWIADDGNAEVECPDAGSGREAAEEYVTDGGWGNGSTTTWVTIFAWRVGLRPVPVECVYCDEPATAHDDAGDPACSAHAGQPEPGVELSALTTVEDIEIGRECHTMAIDPDEPECMNDMEHEWESPHWLVGGVESNPGVWSSGGGVRYEEACLHCGAGRSTDTWAQDPETGEQGLTSVTYTPGQYADALVARGKEETRRARAEPGEYDLSDYGQLYCEGAEQAWDTEGLVYEENHGVYVVT